MKNRVEKMPSLTFFFPYRVISGVPILFARMAKHIAENCGVETRVVDYADGCMSMALANDKSVKMIRFKDGESLEIGTDTILVMQSILPYTIHPELKVHSKTRIIFWTLYHLNLIQTIIPHQSFRNLQAKYPVIDRVAMSTFMRPLRKRLQDFVKLLMEKKSLMFMDGATWKGTMSRLQLSCEAPNYVPVACDDVFENKRATGYHKQTSGISFGWLGRLCDFKIHILIYTINMLAKMAIEKRIPIQLLIIGEGPEAKLLKNLKAENHYFQMKCVGIFSGEALNNYLLEHVDVMVAMGTSALEAAKLGIPAILLDVAYGPIKKDYKFKWIFESSDYGLADFIDETHFQKNNDTLSRMIDEVLSDYLSVSNATYNYYKRTHAMSAVCYKFLNAIEESSFTYGDFDPEIMKKGLIRKLYEFFRGIKFSCSLA